ncbi:maturation protein [ssRNA phage SRR6253161_1]|uniref:Maturation protein n=1 Tax=ssRNA phage SRR6253161_1 TaxID=2786488 RepID=A0A8S5L041_9VIRU|nr:maturation protein [ssRNA phage SRR6253161_1]DAD50936.1 TPA_asm: maturation protein [ssRNA phage SRR6253161_1]
MVMQNRSLQRTAHFTSSTVFMNPPRTQVTGSTSSSQMVAAKNESLQVLTKQNGDYKSPTNHSFEKVDAEFHHGWLHQELNFGSYWAITDSQGPYESVTGLSLPTQLMSQADIKALSNFNEKVRGQLDLAIDLFTRRQTGQMLADAAALSNYVRRFDPLKLKRDFKRFLLSPKRLGSKWLEFQYGWRPLAQSLYESARLATTPKRDYIRVKARGSQAATRVVTSKAGANVTTRVERESARVEFAGLIKLSDGFIQNAAQMSSMNPFSIAWELTPFSFVVDWFYDIGNYVRQAETWAVYRTGWLSGYKTTTSLSTVQSTIVTSSNTATNISSGSRTGTYRRAYKARSVLTSYPFPRPPVFTCDLGSGRLLNAAALLSQFLKR